MLPPPDNFACYARAQLNGRELQLYDDVVAALQMGQVALDAKGIDANRALEIAMIVLRDHPEFYWVAGEASLSGFRGSLRLTKHLASDREFESRFLAEFERITSQIPPACSDYTKAKTIYEAVVGYASYDEGLDPSDQHLIKSHSLWGVFGDRIAVCDGFSSALQYFLQHMGIQSYRLTGTATSTFENGPHSWVLARIDGFYYHIDPTWGAVPLEGLCADTHNKRSVNYDYLCLRDSDIASTHHIKDSIAIEPCTSMVANYYNQEGLLIRFWDERALADALARQMARGSSWLSLRAATEPLFAKLKNLCQGNGALFELFQEASGGRDVLGVLPTQFEYMINDTILTIHISLPGMSV